MIKLEHIDKVFNDGTSQKAALSDINLHFDDSGLVIIMGPSGCGKTTLLNIIALLDEPSAGTYYLDSIATSELNKTDRENHRRTTFAYLFQHYFLLEGFTAYENAWLAECANAKQIDCSDQGLHRRFVDFGLARIMNQPSEELSGGEAQRTALIRALAKDTPIIIADEPTGALDKLNGEFLMKSLKEAARSRLLIVVTHDCALAKRYADRLITMDEGTIIADQVIQATSPLHVRKRRDSPNRAAPSLIGRRFYRLSRRRLGFAFVSLVIGLVTGLLTFGLHQGGPILASEHPLGNPDSNIFYLRRQERIPIENTPMNLIRYERPTLVELPSTGIDLSNAYIDVSLRGLYTNTGILSIDDIVLPTMEFRPLLTGKYPFPDDDEFTHVYLNQAAAGLIQAMKEIQEDSRLKYDMTLLTSYHQTELIADTFECHRELTILDVIDSASIIQTPTVYYSHWGARRFLESLEVTNLSARMGYPISWYDRIGMGAGTDPITNQELMIAFENPETVIESFDKMNQKDEYSWESSYRQERLLLTSVVTALDYGLLLFVSIGALASALTLALSMSRVYADHRRRMAILWELGYPLPVLKNIILSIGRRTAGTALAVSFALTPLIVWLINLLVENRYGLPRIIRIPWLEYQGIAFLLPTTISLIVFSIVGLTIRVLTSRLNTKVLIKELVDDD